MMNWKRCGRKRSTPNLRYSPDFLPEGLIKATKTYEDKPGIPEYKAGRTDNVHYDTERQKACVLFLHFIFAANE
jgi:hypothetical protein